MSIFERSDSFRQSSEYFAGQAVQKMQTGATWDSVQSSMELAAEYRHLSYELMDTWEIARDARAEYLSGLGSVT